MAALIIDDEISDRIKAAVERARDKAIPWEALRNFTVPGTVTEIKLGDRKPGFERVSSEFVPIPVGYMAAISFEHQPAGLIRHLSVSVDRPGMMPSPEAVKMIATEFGFDFNIFAKTWVEEFRPGQHAVNIVQVEKCEQAGIP